MITRPTALAAALFNAANRVPAQQRPGTISNQIIWRADNTTAGVVREPDVRYPERRNVLTEMFDATQNK